MNYGFVIDNSKCIGCHACSTACKSENLVPLGVNRTWVKYVETGSFPSVRRHFQVTRCNHCANSPCTRICPVTAMYQRDNGIVEFDPELCIGCKACMQACPYDAIYIDPDSGTAAKCHYCAHRTALGLEPACVVVCPVHAIIAGDIDDPVTEISHVLATNRVTVRKPEQGTAPKLFYIEGNDLALHPTATDRVPETFLWADVIPLHDREQPATGQGTRASDHPGASVDGLSAAGRKNPEVNEAIRAPQPQGVPPDGPIYVGGRTVSHMVQVAYNAQHKIPWHWPVPAYLVTKGIGTGLFMLLSLGLILDLVPFTAGPYLLGGFLSLLAIAITTGLLVLDLERPERFLYIVLRPQWKSWLTRGAFLLMGFSAVAGLWWLAEGGAQIGWLPIALARAIRPVAMWVGLFLAAGVAVYTGFLFGQAEGRDLWQSPLLPIHLLVQAGMAGSGAMLMAGFALDLTPALRQMTVLAFAGSLIVDVLLILLGEFGMPHASDTAAQAAHDISHGRFKNQFWWGSLFLGHAVPLLLLLTGAQVALAVGGALSILGLYLFEYAFVMAPQEIPNS